MHPDIQLYKRRRIASTIGTICYGLVLVPLLALALTADITTIYYVIALGVVATALFIYESVSNTNRKLRAMRHNAAEVTRVYGILDYGVAEAWGMTKAFETARDTRGDAVRVKTRDGFVHAYLEREGGEWTLVNAETEAPVPIR